MSPFSVPGVDVLAVAPELVAAVGGLMLLVAGLRASPRALASSAALLLTASGALALVAAGSPRSAFDGTVVSDGFAAFFRVALAAVGILSVLASVPLVRRGEGPAPEYFALVLLATSGMMLMASAGDLVLVFVALETFSLAFYVMAGMRRRRRDSQEASLKYFLTGSFASAFFLYGVALVYGGSGSTRLLPIADRMIPGLIAGRGLVLAGLALLVVGMAFKIAAVPFHMWTPDVYQGSPAPAVGFMAAGGKLAAFAVLLRLVGLVFPSLSTDWRPALSALAVLTMVVGSVVAVAQSDVKRMLAYSAIAHSGFLLVGVAASGSRGVSGSLFYLAVYGAVIVGAFAVVQAVAGEEEQQVPLEDYRGLWSRQPFLAVAFAALLISLAGFPPTAGFWAKLEVFAASVAAGQPSLVVIGVLASAVAAFFYLRVIVLMFLEEPREWVGRPAGVDASSGLVALVAALVVAAVGIVPQPLLELARNATFLSR